MADSDILGRLRSALAERYAVERELGQGGTATVYLAQDLRYSRPVAIKVLRPELTAFIGNDRFLSEIATVARLQHPHILPLYDSGDAEGLLYFVMPYVSGDTLRDRLDRDRTLPVDDAVAIARDVAAALTFAHGEGVIHRDIKPENILLFGGAAVVADFGIALARRMPVDTRKTEAGRAIGTPLYMSPEQAAASGEIDVRTDVYSLGCVLYEMLTGQTPFSGYSAEEVMAHHLRDVPRPASELRSTLPPALTLALTKALQKLPADRFTTVAEFSQAIRPTGERTPTESVPVPRWRRRVTVTLGIAAAGGVALMAAAKLVPGVEAPVTNRYLVLPPVQIGGVPPSGATSDQLAMLLRQALARWRDITVVSGLQANDTWRQGSSPGRLRDALAAARGLRAEFLVWGQETMVGDSVRMDVALYNARQGGRTVREASMTFAPGTMDLGNRMADLARRLVADSLSVPASGSPTGTTMVDAWRQYAEGHSALARWKLPEAVEHFMAAAATDPAFASAHFWAAQLLMWSNAPRPRWEPNARAAAAHKERLGSWQDSAHVDALLSLVEQRYPDACDRYRALVRRDSVDVLAWFGLGECQRRDRVVLRDRRSPSRWRFRSSRHQANAAYARAFELAPAAAFLFGDEAFERMQSALFVERGALLVGRPEPPDTGTFAARAALDHDTLALVPYPYPAMMMAPRPATEIEAMARNRALLRAIAERWVTTYPESPRARAAQARVLELSGELGEDSARGRTALTEIRAARQFAPGQPMALVYGSDEVRLLIKLGRNSAARAVADSLLIGWETAPTVAAGALAGLAALVGRIEVAAALFHRSLGDSGYAFGPTLERLTPVLTRASLRFATYAAFGVPAESLPVQVRQVEQLLARYVTPARRRATWHVLMDLPLVFAFPAARPSRAYPGGANGYLAIEADIASGRIEPAQAALRDLATRSRGARPGEIALSTALLDSRLWLAMGDTAEAERVLLAVLENLAVAPTLLIDEPVQAASLVRAMWLAAELAAARGDRVAALRWAQGVVIFWSDADPPLRAIAERLRAL